MIFFYELIKSVSLNIHFPYVCGIERPTVRERRGPDLLLTIGPRSPGGPGIPIFPRSPWGITRTHLKQGNRMELSPFMDHFRWVMYDHAGGDKPVVYMWLTLCFYLYVCMLYISMSTQINSYEWEQNKKWCLVSKIKPTSVDEFGILTLSVLPSGLRHYGLWFSPLFPKD